MRIHILDSVRTNAVRCTLPFTVYVPEGFDRPVVTGCMDRRNLCYNLVALPSALSWYKSFQPALDHTHAWHVGFENSWLDTLPGLYHADFSAGYSGAWPNTGWLRPSVLPSGGSVYLTDAPNMCGSMWGQLAGGIPIEPVCAAVRSQFRDCGLRLHFSGDPPESVEDRCAWLLGGCVDLTVVQHNQSVARQLIQQLLGQWFGLPAPVWAKFSQRYRRVVLDHADAWGFSAV